MASKNKFIAAFNKTIRSAEVFIFITRDSLLQKKSCIKLEKLVARIIKEKDHAITKKDEDYSNLLLGCICVTQMLISEIKMCLFLKDSKPNDAWDQLILSQGACRAAIRAHRGFHHLKENYKRLYAIEKIIFPPQVFASSGFIAKKQICSICAAEYEACDHLAQKPYMGQFCQIIMRDIEIDHVSIVENPADKRCRITSFTDGRGTRDRMTWKVAPVKKSKKTSATSR